MHIGLYGFFYRTAGGQGGRGSESKGDGDDVVDIRPIASFFLLAYALLCSLVATRVIGGTVAASAIAADCNAANDGAAAGSGDGSTRSDLVIQAISSYEVTAAGATDAEAAAGPAATAGPAAAAAETPRTTLSATSRGAGFSHPGREPSLKPDGGGAGHGPASLAAAALVAQATAADEAGQARQESLRRGLKAYMRLTVGMMVGVS